MAVETRHAGVADWGPRRLSRRDVAVRMRGFARGEHSGSGLGMSGYVARLQRSGPNLPRQQLEQA